MLYNIMSVVITNIKKITKYIVLNNDTGYKRLNVVWRLVIKPLLFYD